MFVLRTELREICNKAHFIEITFLPNAFERTQKPGRVGKQSKTLGNLKYLGIEKNMKTVSKHFPQINLNLFFSFPQCSQCVFQIAEYLFETAFREIGNEINKSLDSTPIVGTVKRIVSSLTSKNGKVKIFNVSFYFVLVSTFVFGFILFFSYPQQMYIKCIEKGIVLSKKCSQFIKKKKEDLEKHAVNHQHSGLVPD